MNMKGFEMFPNPSNGQVFIAVQLDEAADIKLELFNSLGQKVSSLEENMSPQNLLQVLVANRRPRPLRRARPHVSGALPARSLAGS